MTTNPTPVSTKPAIVRFNELMGDDKESPLERLRFFCSLAMNGQDWLDVEPFFDALATPAPSVPLGGGEVAWLEIDDIDELADRYGDHDTQNDCYSLNREGRNSVRALVAEVMRRAPTHPLQAQDAAPVEPRGVLTDDELCQLQQISRDVDMFALGRYPYDNNANPNQQWRRATIRDVEQCMKFHAPRLTALVIKLFSAHPVPAGVQGDAARLDFVEKNALLILDSDTKAPGGNGYLQIAATRQAIDAAIASQAGGKD